MTAKGRGFWSLLVWGGAAAAMLAPVIASQLSDEMAWDAFDFAFWGLMLVLGGGAFELLTRRTDSVAYRLGAAGAVGTGFFLIIANGAVGLIGSEGSEANLLYVGVLAVAVIASVVGRLHPLGMTRAMVAAAAAQALAPPLALALGLFADEPILSAETLGVTGFFAVLWLASAGLFWKAARDRGLSAEA